MQHLFLRALSGMKFPALFLVANCAILSCKKVVRCSNVQHVNERVYLMQKYLGGYRPGVAWIYQNRDKSRTDSVYLTNFSTGITGENNNCLSGDVTTFDMHSNYLAGGQMMKVRLGFDESRDQITNIFEIKDASGNIVCKLNAKNDDFTSFFNGSTRYSVQQNYSLSPNLPQIVLPEYIRVGSLIFAPDFGLVQFAATGTNDTFTMIKFVYL